MSNDFQFLPLPMGDLSPASRKLLAVLNTFLNAKASMQNYYLPSPSMNLYLLRLAFDIFASRKSYWFMFFNYCIFHGTDTFRGGKAQIVFFGSRSISSQTTKVEEVDFSIFFISVLSHFILGGRLMFTWLDKTPCHK